jgi:KDO2-lipid IV(A) lauroyltransferase
LDRITLRFLAPRYWLTWLLVGWMRATTALPWRLSIALHRNIGRALWYALPGRRAVVLRNLEICLPELDESSRRATAKRTFESVAISVAEIATAWFASTLPPVRIEGRDHLDAALARGNGAILCSGHFTTLELTAQFLKPLAPTFAFMFRARSNPLLDAVQTSGRTRTADLSFNNTDGRAMLKALRANAAVWYAPDQAYQGQGAELLPFFGEPAMTTTATSRLARISGAPVLPCHFQRLAGDAGYLVRIDPPVDGIPSDDPLADTRVIAATLERSIRECPDQYFWTHRRFRGRGPSLPDAYAEVKALGAARRRALLATSAIVAAVAAFIVSAYGFVGPMS